MSFVAVAIGGAVLAGGAMVAQNNANKKAQRQVTAAQKKQETAAKEAAKLKSTKEDAGAKVKIGSGDAKTAGTDTAKKGRAKKRKNSGAVLGGVAASMLGGL